MNNVARIQLDICAILKGDSVIDIIVHYPETPEKRALFEARVAKFHVEYVAEYIGRLNCPVEQKLRLIDAVAQSVADGCKESEKNNI